MKMELSYSYGTLVWALLKVQFEVYVGNSKKLERLNSERKDMEHLIVRGGN
jgi:hypothetical protein